MDELNAKEALLKPKPKFTFKSSKRAAAEAPAVSSVVAAVEDQKNILELADTIISDITGGYHTQKLLGLCPTRLSINTHTAVPAVRLRGALLMLGVLLETLQM